MNVYEYSLKTSREDLADITHQVQEAVTKSGVQEGLCVVYCPHTTGAITVNENADPSVVGDMLFGFGQSLPDWPEFRHAEGNSAAHIKSSLVGCDQTLIVHEGKLLLGTWQGIYFCEFDGPRNRRFFVKVLG